MTWEKDGSSWEWRAPEGLFLLRVVRRDRRWSAYAGGIACGDYRTASLAREAAQKRMRDALADLEVLLAREETR